MLRKPYYRDATDVASQWGGLERKPDWRDRWRQRRLTHRPGVRLRSSEPLAAASQ
jgi:hypothetical protein